LNDKALTSQPLVALQDDAKGGILRRISDLISSWFSRFL
jgi:hypothetical protein